MIRLAICGGCGAAHHPLREVCGRCLSDQVELRETTGEGTLIASTRIHRSIEPRFAPRLPLAVGSVKLDAGPVAIAFIEGEPPRAGARVRLDTRVDDGRDVFFVA